MERQAREEERAARSCTFCAGLIPVAMKASALFCSVACRDRSRRDRRRLTNGKVCPHCQALFSPLRADQVHCSRACKNAAKRARQMIPCRGCGKIFRNRWGKRGQFCSQSCFSRFNYDAGRAPGLRVRKLTAPRFDAMFG